MRRTLMVVLTSIALLLVIGNAACTRTPPDGEPSPTAGPTVVPTAGTDAPEATPSAPDPVVTPPEAQEVPCAEQTQGWDTGVEESAPYVSSDVTDVRAAPHDCYDRVVFDIAVDSEVGYHVAYVDVVRTGGAGNPVEVAGDAALEVILHTQMRSGPYAGPGETLEEAPDWEALREVKTAGSHEEQITFAVGVRDQLPFSVTTWQDGDTFKVIVDVAHG